MSELKYKCDKCGGLGKLNDADLGDISFNEWDCANCNGKGYVIKVYDGGVIQMENSDEM